VLVTILLISWIAAQLAAFAVSMFSF